MSGSQLLEKDIVLTIYRENQTVFRLRDIAILTGETDFQSLNKKLNYYARTGKLGNPRKGIYTKPVYKREELACSIFTPSYISLQYVLQKAGIIFQYDSRITAVSYLNRNVEVEGQLYSFRKIKSGTLVNTNGIIRQPDHINIASPERAFLDLLYLEKDYYFDNLNPLKKVVIMSILPAYESKALTQRVNKLFKND
jgi:hypothetical protein